MIKIEYCIIFCSWSFAMGILTAMLRATARNMKQAQQAATRALQERETGIIDNCPSYIRNIINHKTA